MHGIRVIRLGAGGYSSRTGRDENCEVRGFHPWSSLQIFCAKAKRSWRQKGNNSLSGIMRDCRLELRGKGVAVRPTDVAFLSNGPIILFNFSIFLPSSIGAIQPFVARGRRRRRTTSSSFTAKRSESFTILGVRVEVPTPLRSLALSKLHTSPATCRFHHNTILFRPRLRHPFRRIV